MTRHNQPRPPSRSRRRNRSRQAAVMLLAALTAGAMVATGTGIAQSNSSSTEHQPGDAKSERPLAPSPPVQLRIPSADITATVTELGNATADTMELPEPDEVGWYGESSPPGTAGRTVLTGFISVGHDRAALGGLGKLTESDPIGVTRRDGAIAHYRVTDITTYEPGSLPAETLYADTSTPTLVLVTTGGRMNKKVAPGNTVVTATFLKADQLTQN